MRQELRFRNVNIFLNLHIFINVIVIYYKLIYMRANYRSNLTNIIYSINFVPFFTA